MDDDEPPSTISVTLGTARWGHALHDPVGLCRRAVEATLARAAPAPWVIEAEVSLLLADDATVRALNRTWRERDRPTNVLSFPALDLRPGGPAARPPGEQALLGDIVLAFETVRAEAAAAGKPLADHLGHLVVHGCLHLLGHDHHSPAEAGAMERLERSVLAELQIPDPYADDAGPAAKGGRAALETVR
jgi:probable rRNA maturation factor